MAGLTDDVRFSNRPFGLKRIAMVISFIPIVFFSPGGILSMLALAFIMFASAQSISAAEAGAIKEAPRPQQFRVLKHVQLLAMPNDFGLEECFVRGFVPEEPCRYVALTTLPETLLIVGTKSAAHGEALVSETLIMFSAFNMKRVSLADEFTPSVPPCAGYFGSCL